MSSPALLHLPAITIEGHQSSGAGGPAHPMRVATRRAAGLDRTGWTADLRDDVGRYFDGLASEWHTRGSSQRMAVVRDAFERGLAAHPPPAGMAVEVGSGLGTYSPQVAERFAPVVAADLSHQMLVRAPAAPAFRVRADGSRLPLADGCAAAVVLINAFLFPSEVDRVLAPAGVVIWVNSSGPQTPIHLSAEELVVTLPGTWVGTASRAGEGEWCVVTRAR